MKAKVVLSVVVWACVAWITAGSTAGNHSRRNNIAQESRIPVEGANLYIREVGNAAAVIVAPEAGNPVGIQ